MHSLLDQYIRTDIPEFKPGDTIRVHQKIKEGDKERMNIFEGIVIAKKHGGGISATFTVRKVVADVGVERVYPLHSPRIAKIEVVRRSRRVRRAKLYYIREKAAREIRSKMKTLFFRKKEAAVVQEDNPIKSDAGKKQPD